MNEDGKPFVASRTVWIAISTILFSAAAIATETWFLLGAEERGAINALFGPGTTGALGIIFLLLRVLTTQPLRRRR